MKLMVNQILIIFKFYTFFFFFLIFKMDIYYLILTGNLSLIKKISIEEIKNSINNDNYLVKKKILRKLTPLHFCVLCYKIDILEDLLIRGFPIDILSDSWTSLHLASFLGYSEIIDILLFYKANSSIEDKYHNTPITISILENNFEVLDSLLIQNLSSEILTLPLQLSIQQNNLEIFKKLLISGANPNLKSISGKSPIEYINPITQIEFKELINITLPSLPNLNNIEKNKLELIDSNIKSLSQIIDNIPFFFKESEILIHNFQKI